MATDTHYYKPPFRPISRSKTSYASMSDWQKRAQKATTYAEQSDWMKSAGSLPNQSVPKTVSDSSWKHEKHRVDIAERLAEQEKINPYKRPVGIPKGAPVTAYSLPTPRRQPVLTKPEGPAVVVQKAPPIRTEEEELAEKVTSMGLSPRASYIPPKVMSPPKVKVNSDAGIKREQTAYTPFVEPSRRDDYYNRYLQLSQNIAHRYPDPGAPRERQGAIGGSWRHVKEVLGHGGSRTIFIDGLVSLYDMDMNWLRNKQSPMQRQISETSFGVSRTDVDSYKKLCDRELEKKSYRPWEHENDALPPINDTTKELPGEPSKYKGFYTMR